MRTDAADLRPAWLQNLSTEAEEPQGSPLYQGIPWEGSRRDIPLDVRREIRSRVWVVFRQWWDTVNNDPILHGRDLRDHLTAIALAHYEATGTVPQLNDLRSAARDWIRAEGYVGSNTGGGRIVYTTDPNGDPADYRWEANNFLRPRWQLRNRVDLPMPENGDAGMERGEPTDENQIDGLITRSLSPDDPLYWRDDDLGGADVREMRDAFWWVLSMADVDLALQLGDIADYKRSTLARRWGLPNRDAVDAYVRNNLRPRLLEVADGEAYWLLRSMFTQVTRARKKSAPSPPLPSNCERSIHPYMAEGEWRSDRAVRRVMTRVADADGDLGKQVWLIRNDPNTRRN